MSAIHVGTSGWHYGHWAEGAFYPPGMRPAQYLSHYATRFACVEVNNSFYRLPSEKTFAAWREAVPDGFRFAVKASGYITHRTRLKKPESYDLFFGRAVHLRGKLGPILVQLPPRWPANPEQLERFLQAVPNGIACAFEFRDPRWFADEVRALLERYGAALCLADFPGAEAPLWITGALVYVRLHGPGGAYQGSYSDEALALWARRCRSWVQEKREVYVFFDNDEKAFAVQDALRLKALLKA